MTTPRKRSHVTATIVAVVVLGLLACFAVMDVRFFTAGISIDTRGDLTWSAFLSSPGTIEFSVGRRRSSFIVSVPEVRILIGKENAVYLNDW